MFGLQKLITDENIPVEVYKSTTGLWNKLENSGVFQDFSNPNIEIRDYGAEESFVNDPLVKLVILEDPDSLRQRIVYVKELK